MRLAWCVLWFGVASALAEPIVVFEDASSETGAWPAAIVTVGGGAAVGYRALDPASAVKAAVLGPGATLPLTDERPFGGHGNALRLSFGREAGWWQVDLPVAAAGAGRQAMAEGRLTLAVRGEGGESVEVGLVDAATPRHTVRVPLARYGPVERGWTLYRIPLADLLALAPELALERLLSVQLFSARPGPLRLDVDHVLLEPGPVLPAPERIVCEVVPEAPAPAAQPVAEAPKRAPLPPAPEVKPPAAPAVAPAPAPAPAPKPEPAAAPVTPSPGQPEPVAVLPPAPEAKPPTPAAPAAQPAPQPAAPTVAPETPAPKPETPAVPPGPAPTPPTPAPTAPVVAPAAPTPAPAPAPAAAPAPKPVTPAAPQGPAPPPSAPTPANSQAVRLPAELRPMLPVSFFYTHGPAGEAALASSKLQAVWATNQGERAFDTAELKEYFAVADGDKLPLVEVHDPGHNGVVAQIKAKQPGFAWWVAQLTRPDGALSDERPYLRNGRLELAVRGEAGEEAFRIGLIDGSAASQIALVPLAPFGTVTTDWQVIRIPLRAIKAVNGSLDWSKIRGVVIASANGRPLSLYFDDLRIVTPVGEEK